MGDKKTNLDMSKPMNETALLKLYEMLKAKNAPKPGSFTALSTAERREYFRVARRRSRSRQREADIAGAFEPNLANVRNALADAALMILATDAPGTAEILSVLSRVFEKKPGVPFAIQRRARSGKLRPKMIEAGQ